MGLIQGIDRVSIRRIKDSFKLWTDTATERNRDFMVVTTKVKSLAVRPLSAVACC